MINDSFLGNTKKLFFIFFFEALWYSDKNENAG